MSAPATHILLVENNLVLAHAAERILSWKLDAEVVLLYSNRNVIRQMSANNFDALVMGWSLEDLDVLPLIVNVRQLHPEIPIILCSDRNDAEGLLAAVEAGANEYLLKPYKPLALAAKVQKALHKNQERYRHQRHT